MKQDQFLQILRASESIKLKDKLTQLQSKAHDYVIQQMKLLESNYKQQLLLIVEQYQECKLICEQLKLKNEQYSKLILEQEFKSIQTKNYVSLEIVNQLLAQKINSLLLQLKNHNIISESEYNSQRNMLQKNIAEIFLNSNEQNPPVFVMPNTQNQKQIEITQQTIKQEIQSQINNQNYVQVNKYYSIATQTEPIKKKKIKPIKQQKQQYEVQQNITIDQSRELLECQKSIQELQKKSLKQIKQEIKFINQMQQLDYRLLDLIYIFYYIQSNFKDLRNLQKYQKNYYMKNAYTPQIIKKFLKFDDMLFKNVRPFSMAQSFDLRQGNISSRQFFIRPNTSAPNTSRNRFNQTQQPSSVGFHVIL